MLTNDVKRKLKAGKAVVGGRLALGDAIVAESLAARSDRIGAMLRGSVTQWLGGDKPLLDRLRP